MRKKILYIIGAGGSAEFLQDKNNESLTTKILTDSLASEKLWSKTLSLIKDICNSNFRNFNLSIDDFWPILQDFNDNFDETYDNNQRLDKVTNNFETQIAYLDFIVDYCKNVKFTKITKFYPANHCGVKIKKRLCGELSDWLKLKMVPVWAREVIHQRINDFEFKAESKKILEKYFNNKLKEYDSVNIYSLNYDCLFSEALRNTDFVTGFNEKEVFRGKDFLDAKHSIAFLHGHQNFYVSGNAIQMAPNFDTAFRLRAEAFWANNHQTITQKMKSPSLITGIDKEKELQVDVYRYYYVRFVNDALKADGVCCIGYSCQDDHVNSIIRLFFDLGRQVTFIGNNSDCSGWECLNQFTSGFLNKGAINLDLSKIRIWCRGAKSFFENNSVVGYVTI